MSVILEIMVFCSGLVFFTGCLFVWLEDLSYVRQEGSCIQLIIQHIGIGYIAGSIVALIYAAVYQGFLEVSFTLAISIMCLGLLTIIGNEFG